MLGTRLQWPILSEPRLYVPTKELHLFNPPNALSRAATAITSGTMWPVMIHATTKPRKSSCRKNKNHSLGALGKNERGCPKTSLDDNEITAAFGSQFKVAAELVQFRAAAGKRH